MTSLSPVYLMYETVRKYGLLSYIQEILLFGNISCKHSERSLKNCINKKRNYSYIRNLSCTDKLFSKSEYVVGGFYVDNSQDCYQNVKLY